MQPLWVLILPGGEGDGGVEYAFFYSDVVSSFISAGSWFPLWIFSHQRVLAVVH